MRRIIGRKDEFEDQQLWLGFQTEILLNAVFRNELTQQATIGIMPIGRDTLLRISLWEVQRARANRHTIRLLGQPVRQVNMKDRRQTGQHKADGCEDCQDSAFL